MTTRRLVVTLMCLSLTLGASLVVAGDPPAAAAVTPVQRLDVKEIQLDNGLRIFVLEQTVSPTFAAVYQFGVGGAFDPKGESGVAHMLEHMMFKGTTSVGTLDAEKEKALMATEARLWDELHRQLDAEQDPFGKPDQEKIAKLRADIEATAAEQKKLIVKNEYDEVMTRAGGVALNAGTGNDTTTYFIQLPANRLELWFSMESDRLLHPVFREFYSERDVVTSERRQTTENTPWGRMWESLDRLLFFAHPYGTPVVGWPKDLARLTRAAAERYFETYYSPSNCVLALVGDVKTAEVERLAKQYFGPWKRQELPRLQVTDEPAQDGERRDYVEFDAEPQVMMGWVTVPEGHPDQYALDVAADILGGLASSRLDRKLVQEERLAAWTGTGHNAMRWGGSFMAMGVPRGEHTPAELEAAIEREITRLAEGGISDEELRRAKITNEVQRVRLLKSNLGQAMRVAGAVTLTGGVDYLYQYEEKINAVTADQVRDAVKRYLVPSHRCVAELVKTPGKGESTARGSQFKHQRGETVSARGTIHSKGFTAAMERIRSSAPVELKVPEIGKDVRRVKLPSGITVFVKEDHTAPSVEMGFAWLGGANTTPVEKLAPFSVATQLMNEGGTEALDPFQLQEKVDETGMRFSVDFGETETEASFWSLARNFDETFALALDMLMRPRFDAERLQTVKGQFIEEMRRRYENPRHGADLIQRYVLDHDHPRLGYEPSKKEVEAVTAADVRAIWQRYLGKDNLYVTVVGDFNADEMLALIDSKLGSWRNAEDSKREYIAREPVVRPGVFEVEKELPNPSISVALQLPVDRTASMADHAAIEILNEILGGSGFRSRLMERLRSDEGLTYGIYSRVSHQGRPGVPGSLVTTYQTGKDTVAYSLESVFAEVAKIVDTDVSQAEVDEQVEAWRNRFIFRYTNAFYSVSRLMYNELDDRPYDFDRQELAAVQKVTVADVRKVAKQYLKPESLTVSIFGSLTDADRTALQTKRRLTVLPKDVVFAGGYEAEEQPPAPGGPRP